MTLPVVRSKVIDLATGRGLQGGGRRGVQPVLTRRFPVYRESKGKWYKMRFHEAD